MREIRIYRQENIEVRRRTEQERSVNGAAPTHLDDRRNVMPR